MAGAADHTQALQSRERALYIREGKWLLTFQTPGASRCFLVDTSTDMYVVRE